MACDAKVSRQEEDGAGGCFDLYGAVGEVAELAQHGSPEVQQREEAGDTEENCKEDQGVFPAPLSEAAQSSPDFGWQGCQGHRLLRRSETPGVLLFRDE